MPDPGQPPNRGGYRRRRGAWVAPHGGARWHERTRYRAPNMHLARLAAAGQARALRRAQAWRLIRWAALAAALAAWAWS